ncbi:MAG: hypothetical protein MJZ61_01435 [Bacteroidales bacterium]|nr:hypothetical protein [Bacteroidales bacterium]
MNTKLFFILTVLVGFVVFFISCGDEEVVNDYSKPCSIEGWNECTKIPLPSPKKCVSKNWVYNYECHVYIQQGKKSLDKYRTIRMKSLDGIGLCVN